MENRFEIFIFIVGDENVIRKNLDLSGRQTWQNYVTIFISRLEDAVIFISRKLISEEFIGDYSPLFCIQLKPVTDSNKE